MNITDKDFSINDGIHGDQSIRFSFHLSGNNDELVKAMEYYIRGDWTRFFTYLKEVTR